MLHLAPLSVPIQGYQSAFFCLCNCEILSDKPHSLNSVSSSMTANAKRQGRECINCGVKYNYQLYVHVRHARLRAE